MNRQVALEVGRVAVSQALALEGLSHMKTDLGMDYNARWQAMVLSLSAYVAKDTLKDVEIKVPILPEWFKKRYRVKYETHTYRAEALYPMLRLPGLVPRTLKVTHTVNPPYEPEPEEGW